MDVKGMIFYFFIMNSAIIFFSLKIKEKQTNEK